MYRSMYLNEVGHRERLPVARRVASGAPQRRARSSSQHANAAPATDTRHTLAPRASPLQLRHHCSSATTAAPPPLQLRHHCSSATTAALSDATMRLAVALAIFCFGAAACGPSPPAAPASAPASARAPRSPAAAQRLLQQLLADYGAEAEAEEQYPRPAAYPLRAVPIELPIGAASGSRRSAPLRLLLLPVPLPARAAPRQRTECDLRSGQDQYGADDDYDDYVPEPKPRRPSRPRPAPRRRPAAPRFPSYVRADQLDEAATSPPVGVAVSSKELLEKFRAQAPTAPQLPPVLLSEHDASERAPRPDDHEPAAAYPPAAPPAAAPSAAPSRSYLPTQTGFGVSFGSDARAREPPRPRLARSLLLRGELTVRRADYTETYKAWWDASSGAARVDFYGGATSTYRTPLPGGGVQRLEMRVDRSGEGELRRCGLAERVADAPDDRAPPALPDLQLFSFAGYAPRDGERAELWRHTLAGRVGELGAARGEALTFRHELLLRRAADDSATPLRYTVGVDSSVLGADCDGYEHRYSGVQQQEHDPRLFAPDIGDLCDYVEQLNSSSAEHSSRLEPLREFTLPHRDPQYDEAIERFKAEYNRQYVDEAEEAMRKNLLMQHMRFTRSGNREGATFELGVNFLGDRLDAELDELLGVRAEPERELAEPFPHSRSDLRAADKALPERFDWRPRGAVSPVRYQGSCASCWAFAVAGAVEGALFVRTARLTPLSEKCLVDCAHPFGGNGCKGTWPSHAYDYVQSRGLPALADYPPYKDKVERCAEPSARPVTRISAHVNVTANSVPALKVAIRKHAPTVVIVDAKAKSFVFYKKGVLYDDRCGKAGGKLNHAVLAVGWGARRGEPHFVLKNSWSEAWGERGFVRVQARANTCGVLAKPSYPRLERADVLRAAPGEEDEPVDQ
ncbi:uncharacterized protein LOC123865029 [Maniola jurtina]|uniref:uncharacterized protein LOC123865029 n=1 Tax=Maniola jurtina TaxID=191418 RepID=UPI001E68CCCB|nr:uncharacterized protein LOC123865029 [Maniola jurtina]